MTAPYDFTPEEEAAQDAREAERQDDEWLRSWADDFHSDEWAEAAVVAERRPSLTMALLMALTATIDLNRKDNAQ